MPTGVLWCQRRAGQLDRRHSAHAAISPLTRLSTGLSLFAQVSAPSRSGRAISHPNRTLGGGISGASSIRDR
jgi:hypothetical protein